MHSSQKANSSMHKSNPYRYPWLQEPEYKSVKKEFKKDSLKKTQICMQVKKQQ